MFDLFDIVVSEFLGVPVWLYVKTIERTTCYRGKVIITNAFNGTNREKTKRIFWKIHDALNKVEHHKAGSISELKEVLNKIDQSSKD